MSEDKKKILILDDEQDIQTYLSTLLEDNGYATEIAENGEVGMEKAKAGKPDLITLDISMPGKSGVKFYRELKADPELAGIPVVIVTGVTGYGGASDDFKKFISTRKQVPAPDAFMPKPIEAAELLKKVAELLA